MSYVEVTMVASSSGLIPLVLILFSFDVSSIHPCGGYDMLWHVWGITCLVYSLGTTPNWTSYSFFSANAVRQFGVLWCDGCSFSVHGTEVGWYPSSVPPIPVHFHFLSLQVL